MEYDYKITKQLIQACKTGDFESAKQAVLNGADVKKLSLLAKEVSQTRNECASVYVYGSPVLVALSVYQKNRTNEAKELLSFLIQHQKFPIKQFASVLICSSYKERHNRLKQQEKNYFPFSAADYVRLCRQKQFNMPGAVYLKSLLTNDPEILKLIEQQIRKDNKKHQKRFGQLGRVTHNNTAEMIQIQRQIRSHQRNS